MRTNKLMKSDLRILMCCLVLQGGSSVCLAHDNTTVHPKITASAAQSSVGLQNFLSENYARATEGTVNWLIAGSVYEDIPFTRGFNHFYDPTKHPALGLTDGFDWGAHSSFEWATEDLTQFGNQSFPWRLVRAYELNALTNSSRVARQQSLDWTMFYLGHVIHLNQDLTVPAHVRNDNHGLTLKHGFWETWIMWTENYGRDVYSKQDPAKAFPLQTQHQGWAWWQNTAKFQKLENFWNRDFLSSGGANALNSDAGNEAGKQLGLSEFCNGNFISEDSPYGEFFFFRGKHWFQYPSLADTTQPKLRPYNLADSVDAIELRNHKEGNRLRIRKAGAGIIVTNHSALNYLAVKNTPKLGNAQMQVTLTLHDDKVLQEYHEKLIPKAVEYSAGILDYFFRGTMTLSVSGDDLGSLLTVSNSSSQDFHGGAFFILIETNGFRTLVQSNALNGLLPSGGSIELTYAGAATNQYLVFYQGTIGWTNNEAMDPVDAAIAVAISFPPPITVTANPLWTDSGLSVTIGQMLAISAPGTWCWGAWTDADGTDSGSTDVFLAGANQGSLIAYVGTNLPYCDSTGADRWGDTNYFPRPAGNGYWLAGKKANIITDRTGELWFLINDDAVSKNIGDNSGSLEVTVLVKP